jgi:Leucine-rich repeat (LRR) protein
MDRNELTADKCFPAIAHLANLEHLSLEYNKINSLEGLKGIHLPRLKVLKMYGNQVEKLSKQTFATLPGLAYLELGCNEITEIEMGAFDGMVNLRVLSFFDSKLKVFYFNVFEIGANKLGSPVNLIDLKLDADATQSVRWAPDTIELEDESMPKAKKKKQPDEDSAARLFAKCGFRNKLDVRLRRGMPDCNFLDALADRVRLSFF